jgi:uncharacterized membrane protein YukC
MILDPGGTMDETTGPNPQITTRLDRDVYDRAVAIAEELYDGNMAMLARIAIKRYVASNEHLVSTRRDERMAVAS